ncbi:MAG TPA: cyclodeaminase/cyclohydrolase family protein [Gaiellaceae bacterium]|nr:cyclodeaminase/cyclohydrolase family protein [Gaiellaceae bacterium]
MTGVVEEVGLGTMSLQRFAAALASAEPAPGGSTAAAVPGALAAGLVAMAARLTMASDPFSDLAFDLDAIAQEADELRVELLELVDEDAEAFARVIEALGPPRATPDEIERAYEAAVEPPSHVCRLSSRVLELADEVAARGDPHAAADARVAKLFASASLEAAAVTVETLSSAASARRREASRRSR